MVGMRDPQSNRKARSRHKQHTLLQPSSHVFGLLRSDNDDRPRYRKPGPALELDCLRGGLAPFVLRTCVAEMTARGAKFTHQWSKDDSKVAHACGCRLEIPLELLGGLIRLTIEIEGADEFSISIHQIDECGMVHCVVTILERHLLDIHAIC